MQIHIVGGFLGSGKTTAIVAAARTLIAAGKRVGIITNDQGKYLVDSAFVSQSHLPGVEVTGGCFCCNYNDLDQRLDQLIAEENPDVVFAESVGSCADLVATVIKPMLQLRRAAETPTSFSVFTDSRLLRFFLSGTGMPFSDEVSYIFGKQIEESRLVVLNKSDLLSSDRQARLLADFRNRFPEKTAILQCSLADAGVSDWLEWIVSGKAPLPQVSPDIDYLRYGAGEAKLAWVDEAFYMTVPEGNAWLAAQEIVTALFQRLQAERAPVGHVKFLFDDGISPCKISLTTLAQPGWQYELDRLKGTDVRVLVNARVEMAADRLRAILDETMFASGWVAQIEAADAFHPRQPTPTYRFN